jgi:hypothetical protein
MKVIGAPGWADFEGEVIYFQPMSDGVTKWAIWYGPGTLDFDIFDDQYVQDV